MQTREPLVLDDVKSKRVLLHVTCIPSSEMAVGSLTSFPSTPFESRLTRAISCARGAARRRGEESDETGEHRPSDSTSVHDSLLPRRTPAPAA
jgi:hypothetical protein